MGHEVFFGYVYDNKGYHNGKQPFEGTPDNIANFIMYNRDHDTVVTDVLDRFVVSSMRGGFLDRVCDMDLRDTLAETMYPMQIGEKEPIDVVAEFDLEQRARNLDSLAEEKGLFEDEDLDIDDEAFEQ